MRKSLWLVCIWSFVLGFYGVSGFFGCSNDSKDEKSKEVVAEKTTGETSKGEKSVGEVASEKAVGDGGQEDPGKDAGQEDIVKEAPPKEDPVKPEPNPNVGKIRWSVSVQGAVKSMVLSPDGKTVYVSAKAFNALDATDGKELWTMASLGPKLSVPVMGSDGTIYLTTQTKFLYAIDPVKKGTAWNAKLTAEGHKFPPALGKDDAIIVAAGNTIQAIKKPGTSVWSKNYVLNSTVTSPPAVGPDGTIYVCGKDLSLHAIKATGEKRWEKSLGGKEPCRYISTDVDGTIYTGGSSLHAYGKDGKAKWTPQTRFGVVTTTVVIHQSFLYFGTFGGKLYKVTKSDAKPANILWANGVTISVNDEITFAPTIGAGGLVYIASIDSTDPEIQFINPTRGKVERSVTSREPFAGHPAIGKDGTLYVGTNGGTIFAVWTDSLGLANSPWPRGLRDNRNSSYLK